MDDSQSGFVGNSEALARALEAVAAVASTKSTVLVRGESGVGKELFARAVHAQSRRAHGPMVKVNCASIPKTLFESEFFGHVRGSFTGAHRDRIGRFELADGGTIFLDEVGEIPIELQAKLLRVLQENEIERVGEERTRAIDVRVIAATNRDLEADVEAGLFRSDLYYRLSVFPIDVPALRERLADVIPLAEHFLAIYAAESGRDGLRLEPAHHEALLSHDWPGNIRELQHVIERAVILSQRPPLRLDRAMPARSERGLAQVVNRPSGVVLKENEIRRMERDNILAALEKSRGRVAGNGGAAELLGVHPSTLRDRMRTFGVQR